jgi:hypothetical protein
MRRVYPEPMSVHSRRSAGVFSGLKAVNVAVGVVAAWAGHIEIAILIDWFVQGAKFPVEASASVAAQTADPVNGNNSATVSVTKG